MLHKSHVNFLMPTVIVEERTPEYLIGPDKIIKKPQQQFSCRLNALNSGSYSWIRKVVGPWHFNKHNKSFGILFRLVDR